MFEFVSAIISPRRLIWSCGNLLEKPADLVFANQHTWVNQLQDQIETGLARDIKEWNERLGSEDKMPNVTKLNGGKSGAHGAYKYMVCMTHWVVDASICVSKISNNVLFLVRAFANMYSGHNSIATQGS